MLSSPNHHSFCLSCLIDSAILSDRTAVSVGLRKSLP
uniref:Uncharacterized protein n=1 Tax=Setaria italica TaxID=4555 RepID=K3YBP6_SETIT